MTTIYLIRHGEAEGNLCRRAHGQTDTQLTPFGREQVARLTARFEDITVDAVYASDLTRAKHTVQTIADGHHVPLQLDATLREIHLGDWECVAWTKWADEDPVSYENFTHHPQRCTLKNGESPTQAQARFYQAMTRIATMHPDQTVVVGAHGAVITYFLLQVLSLAMDQSKEIGFCENTSVNRLQFDGNSFTLQQRHDASHLAQSRHPFWSARWDTVDPTKIPMGEYLRFSPVDLSEQSALCMQYLRPILGDRITVDLLEKNLKLHPESVSFAWFQNRVVGLCYADLSSSDDTICQIGAMVLDESLHGIGFAPQLIGQLMEVARQMGKRTLAITLSHSNQKAVKFFQKIGFVPQQLTDDSCCFLYHFSR